MYLKILSVLVVSCKYLSVRPSVSNANVSGPYLLYYLRQESQIWFMDASLDDRVLHTVLDSL